ncbi:MAG TPA: non-canonical purine NTP pyrophosphatase [Candidatus Nanoarchaeia archaeon]|nr:non-canonical purine NTP pyrophosphatase [Candidatus Nanoarchaeia archaeon]
MTKLLIATKNQGKYQGIKTVLSSLPVELISLDYLQIDDSLFIEDGKTFAENAEKKAKFYSKKSKLMTLADDSGIEVEALQGELGIKTRRWGLGEKASDEEWLNFFLKRMEKEKNRRAKFISCICLADKDGNVLAVGEGEVQGTLTEDIQASLKPGVPLSSIFLPDGSTKVHSAMTFAEKEKISHRGKALRPIKEYLKNFCQEKTTASVTTLQRVECSNRSRTIRTSSTGPRIFPEIFE